MRDHGMTLLGGLLSLLILIALMQPDKPSIPLSKPHTMDHGNHGLFAMKRWLDENQVNTYSLRRRYQYLGKIEELTENGNLMISTLPFIYGANVNEIKYLKNWIEKGNSIVLMNAMVDSPKWLSNGSDAESSVNDLLKELGYQYVCNDDDTTTDSNVEKTSQSSLNIREKFRQAQKTIVGLKEIPIDLYPQSNHPVMADVFRIESRYVPSMIDLSCRFESLQSRFIQPLLEIKPDTLKDDNVIDKNIIPQGDKFRSSRRATQLNFNSTVMWQVRIGDGMGWVFSFSDIFSHRTLAKADNNQLLLNMINLSVKSYGTVIFDDLHQGLSDLYDPDAFFSDDRLHNTLWFLGAFWLLYLLGHINRLTKPKNAQPIISSTQFIQATAGYYARRLSSQTVAKNLIRYFFNDISLQKSGKNDTTQSNSELAWIRIENCSAIPEEDIAELKNSINCLDNNHKIDLIRLHQLLIHLKKALK